MRLFTKHSLSWEFVCRSDKNMIHDCKTGRAEDAVLIAKRFEALGYRIYAIRGTANTLKEHGCYVIRTNKLEQPAPNLMDLILWSQD